jgi:hypothetical protein
MDGRLADQAKSGKSALTTRGLRLLRETAFEPPGLRAYFRMVAADNSRLALHPPNGASVGPDRAEHEAVSSTSVICPHSHAPTYPTSPLE